MTRIGAVALLISGLGLALFALWLGGGMMPVPWGPSGSGPSRAGAGDLEARLRAVELVPLDGAPAATFTLPTLAGPQVSLADFQGRPVLLYFWATW